MGVTFHYFCHILLAVDQSQVLPILKGRELYKDVTLTLGCVYHWEPSQDILGPLSDLSAPTV